MIKKNRLEITGNLVADPELRYTPKGTAVVRARILHTDSHKDRESGQWKKGKPMGIDFEVWGAYAETFVQKVRKGTAVLLDGRLKPNEFTGKDGTKYFGLRLRVDQWQVIAHPRAKDAGEQVGHDAEEPRQEGASAPKGRGRRGAAANG